MQKSIKKIVVASVQDPRDHLSWSGSPAQVCEAFERKGIEVVAGGPLKAKDPRHYNLIRSMLWRTGQGWFMSAVEPRMLKSQAHTLTEILRNEMNVELILSMLPDGITYLQTDIPKVFVHDCTFASMLGYYWQYERLSRRSLRQGHDAYRRALGNVTAAVFSSEWAAQSAIHDYGADPSMVHVIEFGANLQNPPSRAEVESYIAERSARPEKHFLFLGVEWARKGGKDALALVRALRKMKIDARLDIAGCAPELEPGDEEFCIQHGFLDKRKEEGRRKLDKLFAAASYLLVPSTAECYGCVYCEASAYGMPSIARNTGGVSQVVREGVNGFLLEKDSGNLETLAEQMKLSLEEEMYLKLARSSRAEYETRLNWDRFSSRLMQVMGYGSQTAS